MELEKIQQFVNDLFTHRYEDNGSYDLNMPETKDLWIDLGEEEGYKLYVKNILTKMNIASVMHLNRTVEWIKGFIDSVESDNWFAAAACLRGAMEAAGDGREGFKLFATFLAKQKTQLEQVLTNGAFPEERTVYKEIESAVNKFIFAANEENLKRRGEGYLKELGNSSSRALIKTLAETLGPEKQEEFLDYYAQLCEITHPSGYPIRSMYTENSSGCAKMNKNYMMYGFKNLLNIFENTYQQIVETPIFTSLLVMRELSILGINPQNDIHKYYSMKNVLTENQQINIVQNVFGLDKFGKMK